MASILFEFDNRIRESFFKGCIAATIVVEILFAAQQAKRLERKACMPPKTFIVRAWHKMIYIKVQ
jgi:hypothetical protein